MTTQEFEQKIRADIDPGLYVEPVMVDGAPAEDIERVMYAYKGKSYYVCAVPRRGVKEEFDPNYQSDRGHPFHSRENMEAKIRHFVSDLPNNLDLYE